MADYSSRRLLNTPTRGSEKPYSSIKPTTTSYKLPLLILLQLSASVACIAGAGVILLASHKDPVQAWNIRPAVWLSLLTGLYLIVLAALFSTGVAVVWWRCIAHGTTLERLHLVYAGAGPKDMLSAFMAGWHARKVATAALFVLATKLAIGPMLQRSTMLESYVAERDMGMTMNIASEIPDAWFTLSGASKSSGTSTSQATFFGDDITTGNATDHICPTEGICRANVQAAGLNLWNNTDSTTLNLLDPANLNQTLFSINLTINSDFGMPILFLETQFISAIDSDCIATVTRETYGMIPATMRYPITIQGDRVIPDILDVIENPVIISNTSNANGTSGALYGLLRVLRPIYVSKGVLNLPESGKFATYAPAFEHGLGNFWADMFASTEVIPESQYSENVIKHCPLIWKSPTKYVMSRILDYAFRTARAVADQRQDQQDKQGFLAVYTGEEFRYVTDFRWLVASIVVMVLGMLAALSLSWGWWQLGRHVTLSPLETAKALGAPLLAQAGAEQEIHSILRVVGHELVAYDDELIWAGSLYSSGVEQHPTASPGPGRSSNEPGSADVPPTEPSQNHLPARHRRRTVRSLNEADPLRITRAFEHDHSYTTRTPYGGEPEMDISQYGRPWANHQSNDNVPLIQMLSNIAAPGSAPPYERVPPSSSVPTRTTMQMRSPGERKRSRRASVRSSLPSIEERSTPTPDIAWR